VSEAGLELASGGVVPALVPVGLATEPAVPLPVLELVSLVVALAGFLCSVGRSGSETGSVSCGWPAEPELLPEPLPAPPLGRSPAGCLR
jgi:hypothetical protein